MPLVLVPLAEGVEELEAVTIIDLLRRAGVEVVSAGLVAGPVTGSRGTVLVPDSTLDAEQDRDFDMLVLPGGLPGADHLEQDPRIQRLIRRQIETGRYVAAICAAPRILARAGLLDDRTVTGYPGTLSLVDFPRLRLSDDPVVVDGILVTSRGPGTAMDFALRLIDLLVGHEQRLAVEAKLERPMLGAAG